MKEKVSFGLVIFYAGDTAHVICEVHKSLILVSSHVDHLL